MKAIFNCECADGHTVTGSSRWDPEELSGMDPLQLAAAVSEQRDFARYYTSHFYTPIQKLKRDQEDLLARSRTAKTRCIASGIAAAAFTVLWLMFALIPALRFSGVTLTLALLTLTGILVFIPMLLSFLTAQGDYETRRPRYRSRLNDLLQKQEKTIYGNYLEYTISGYLVSPDFCMQEDAMNYLAEMLNSRRASTLAEANLLVRKKFGKSSVPSIITKMQLIQESDARPNTVHHEPPAVVSKQQQPQQKGLTELVRLSEDLTSSLRAYSECQSGTAGPESSGLTPDEKEFLLEFRSLNAQEQLRIRRIVRSFRTGTI